MSATETSTPELSDIGLYGLAVSVDSQLLRTSILLLGCCDTRAVADAFSEPTPNPLTCAAPGLVGFWTFGLELMVAEGGR